MKPNQLIVNVNSENPETLNAFYADVVGLERDANSGGFLVGGAMFIVDGHSEVRGKTKEPPRVLVNFFVDDLASEHRRLVEARVPCTREMGREPWGGVFSTFVDPDGNYFQVAEYKPES